MESTALPQARTIDHTIGQCSHCGENVTTGNQFCCAGCEAAAEVKAAVEQGATTCFAADVVTTEDGEHHLALQVKGMHCASCMQLIEHSLLSHDQITHARVNLSTERLHLSWHGEPELAEQWAAAVHALGYHVRSATTPESLNTEEPAEKRLLVAIAVAGFAAGNLMLLSSALWSTSTDTMGFATRNIFHWLSALIAMPAVLFCGRVFFESAWSVLKQRRTNMDVPISIAIILATAISLFETINHGEHAYFDSAVMLLFFLLIGRYLDARAKGKARANAQELLSMLQGSATVIEADGMRPLPIRDLTPGMRIMVAMGERIPCDGVSEAVGEVDVSIITGETLPQRVEAGDALFAGALNVGAPFTMMVSKAGDDSLLSDIVTLMEKAEQGQARYVRLADKAAQLYTPVVHSLGALTFIGWMLLGMPWQSALLHAVTVLIITCPCALGLAVPVVQVLASSRLMKRGVLLKSGDALERLATITMMVFDKTGTLTLGTPTLHDGSYDQSQLELAASLATHSKHPLAIALAAHAGDAQHLLHEVEEVPGCGMQARWGDAQIRLGSRDWCGEEAEAHPDQELWLNMDGAPIAQFILKDQLRPEMAQVIAELHAHGIRTAMLSGDREETVAAMAAEAGIKTYASQLMPIEKCDYLERWKAEGEEVCMVGDGLNDAPSLASAAVSISPSTAMDITQNTADIVFQSQSARAITHAWRVAKRSTQLVKQNFGLAVIYNIIAVPIAVLGYATPMVAAIAMSGSSLIVIGNSFRLKKGTE